MATSVMAESPSTADVDWIVEGLDKTHSDMENHWALKAAFAAGDAMDA